MVMLDQDPPSRSQSTTSSRHNLTDRLQTVDSTG